MVKKKPLKTTSSSASFEGDEIQNVGDSIQTVVKPSKGTAKPVAPVRKRTTAPYCIFISTLAVSDVTVIKPIPVTVETEPDESYIASFLEAGISSGGDSLRNAVWSLQDMIASSYRMLGQMSDEQLGPKRPCCWSSYVKLHESPCDRYCEKAEDEAKK
jgi:hypothetical protein